jgi:uncharacterized membrane protein YccC
MTDNKKYRRQLQGQHRVLAEHLEKIDNELRKPAEYQDKGLISHWEKTVRNCREQIAKLERRLDK